MAEIVAFEDFRRSAEHNETSRLFKGRPAARTGRAGFPSVRPGISGNLGDLFEQANAVIGRYYDGDRRVPAPVAEKCLELLDALSEHAEPE